MNADPMLWTGLGCIAFACVILWRRAARKARVVALEAHVAKLEEVGDAMAFAIDEDEITEAWTKAKEDKP